MNKDLLKKITYLTGTIGIFVAGLVYILCADLITKTASTWLFGAILFSFGSGACAILSDKFKDSHKVFFTLKGLAIGLALGFIVYLIIYQVVAVPQLDEDFGYVIYGTIIDIITIVISVLALGALGTDLGFSIVGVKSDE